MEFNRAIFYLAMLKSLLDLSFNLNELYYLLLIISNAFSALFGSFSDLFISFSRVTLGDKCLFFFRSSK